MSYPQLDLPSLINQVGGRHMEAGFSYNENISLRIHQLKPGNSLRSNKFNTNPGCRYFTHDKAEWISMLNFHVVLNGAQDTDDSYFHHGSARRKEMLRPKQFKGDRTTFGRKAVSVNQKRLHTSDDMWRREEERNCPHRMVKLEQVRGAMWSSFVDCRRIDQWSDFTEHLGWGGALSIVRLFENVNFFRDGIPAYGVERYVFGLSDLDTVVWG